MKVRPNSLYIFEPVFIDRNAYTQTGATVRVINLHGCPPANTMGQCYIVPMDNPIGDTSNFEMVSTASLRPRNKLEGQ